MRSKGVSEGMRPYRLCYTRIFRGSADRLLNAAFIQMVSSDYAAAWIFGKMMGWKYILPAPLIFRSWIFSCHPHQGAAQARLAFPRCQIHWPGPRRAVP